MASKVVLRQLTCRWPDCGLVFYICNSCYRGHRLLRGHLPKESADGNSGGEPTIRYQLESPEVLRRSPCQRQREYRERCRLKARERSYFRRQWPIGQHRGASEGNGNEHTVGGGIARSAPV